MKLYSKSSIGEIKSKYNFNVKKSLGQNFLADRNIIDKIFEAAQVGPDDLVVEIGPGMGVLTREAAERAAGVIAVEVDSSLIPILKDTLSEYDNVTVINSDILKTDIDQIIKENSQNQQYKNVKIIGNLPYYITTPIIMKLLEDKVNAQSITVMMQKEVADRIKAGPGSKIYGAISVAVQFYCDISSMFMVPKEVFVPSPKVDSAVLSLSIKKDNPVYVANKKVFFECVKKGFGQRRKTLLNSLTGSCGLDKNKISEILNQCDIDPQRRAETLSIEDFAGLANCIVKKEI